MYQSRRDTTGHCCHCVCKCCRKEEEFRVRDKSTYRKLGYLTGRTSGLGTHYSTGGQLLYHSFNPTIIFASHNLVPKYVVLITLCCRCVRVWKDLSRESAHIRSMIPLLALTQTWTRRPPWKRRTHASFTSMTRIRQLLEICLTANSSKQCPRIHQRPPVLWIVVLRAKHTNEGRVWT